MRSRERIGWFILNLLSFSNRANPKMLLPKKSPPFLQIKFCGKGFFLFIANLKDTYRQAFASLTIQKDNTVALHILV